MIRFLKISQAMNNSDELIQYAGTLRDKMWKTKGSRFNAVRRLNKKNQWSIASISILSVYGISIPIIQSNMDSTQCPQVNSWYNLIAILLSIFILVLSLLEGSQNYQIRAERLHQSAMEISALHSKLDYLFKCQLQDKRLSSKLEKIVMRYEELVSNCPENHEIDDYTLFRVQHRDYFKICKIYAKCIEIKLFFQNYWLYIFFVVSIPPLVISLYLSC